MENIYKQDLERFSTKYIINGAGCHVWKGYLDKDGYGTFLFKRKQRKAHRVAVFFDRGDIPRNLVVDHVCKVRNCVNPEHLRVVTVRENSLQNSNSIGAINSKRTHCKNGHTFDKIYGTKKKQRYCSICENEKSKRLQKKWLEEANKIRC